MSEIKTFLYEYMEEREKAMNQRMLSNSMGVLLIGVLIGIILSYTALVPLTIGLIIGYSLSSNYPSLLNVQNAVQCFDVAMNGVSMLQRLTLKRD